MVASLVAASLALPSPRAHAFTGKTAERECDAAPAGDPSEPPPSAETPPADPARPTPTEPTTAAPMPVEAVTPESTAEALGRTPKRVKCLDESLVDEFGRTSARKGV
ncbi:MAG TPA: hypothetical protein VFG69_20180, partial [Nannocystaceae bacterium]|nr:hypothetical protein [Nannocystaceae bacterium]